MTVTTKRFLLVGFEAIVIYVLFVIAAGAAGHNYKFLTGCVLYFLATYLNFLRVEQKLTRLIVAAILLLPPTIVELPIHIAHFSDTLISLPSSFAAYFGVFSAVISFQFRGIKRYVFIVLFGMVSLWGTFIGYDAWIHRLNFGSFSQHTVYIGPQILAGRDQSNQVITNGILHGKITLLDFWYTRCGICFTKFPQLQKLYDLHKSDTRIAIWAVDKPIPQDTTNEAFAVLKRLGYTFPILLPEDHSLPEKFGVFYYPTTIIIDTSGTVVFKGEIEKANTVLNQLLK